MGASAGPPGVQGQAFGGLVVECACSSPSSVLSAPNLLIVVGEAGVRASGVER